MREAFKVIKPYGSINRTLPELNIKWKTRKEDLLRHIIGITEEYDNQGYKLTLRQLYYQLVARDFVPNHLRVYIKISDVLVEARMGGLVDWDIIEDRGRIIKEPYWETDPESALNDMIKGYRLRRQDNQHIHIEVWCEKDALSGVLYQVTGHYGIPLLINKGYSSASAMYKAYKRFERNITSYCRPVVLLYFGDHDPSGLDMIRDIRDRLFEFGISSADFNIVPVALTREQIREYNPPPNFAKIMDPRAKEYIVNNGEDSWELDALPPMVLNEILERNIDMYMDADLFTDRLDLENKQRESLKKLRGKL